MWLVAPNPGPEHSWLWLQNLFLTPVQSQDCLPLTSNYRKDFSQPSLRGMPALHSCSAHVLVLAAVSVHLFLVPAVSVGLEWSGKPQVKEKPSENILGILIPRSLPPAPVMGSYPVMPLALGFGPHPGESFWGTPRRG